MVGENLELLLSAPATARLVVSLNGTPVGEAVSGRQDMRLPARLLYRGDNLLALERRAGEGPVALTRIALQPGP